MIVAAIGLTVDIRETGIGPVSRRIADAHRMRLRRDATAMSVRHLQPEARAPLAIVAITGLFLLSQGSRIDAKGQDVQASAADPARTAICEAIGQKYRALLGAPAGRKLRRPQDILATLTRASASGVTYTPALLQKVDPAKLADWAKSQKPPFSIPQTLLDDLNNNTGYSPSLDHAPGTNFYAVNGIAGTLDCYQHGVYFQVENGRAKATEAPPGWATRIVGDGCLARRAFGMVDNVSVAFEESSNTNGFGTYSLDVTPWHGNGFGPDCTVTLRFSQVVMPAAQGDSEQGPDSCNGDRCAALKAAALHLVRKVQANARTVQTWRKSLIASLSATQARQFKTMEVAANDSDETSVDVMDRNYFTADLTTQSSSLALPLIVGNELYLTKVGHTQVHGIVQPDWRVRIYQSEDTGQGERDLATFDFTMKSDQLLDVSVQ